MAWISGYVRFDKPAEQQRSFNGDIFLTKVDDLIFHGVIAEEEGKNPVSGALIKVFAQSASGGEVPLCHSYSSGDGHYLLSISKNKIPAGTASIIIRAVANNPQI